MNERDEALGRLTEELAAALAHAETIDAAAWAARFEVAADDVLACVRTLRALDGALGEEAACGPAELPRPTVAGYTIERELGRGGMGVVYRAQHQALGRAVAIKVLRPGDLVFGDALARFRSEAKSLARLRHRHIVSVHDVGETEEGLVWFAMDLIEGETLAAEIARRGALLPARAVRILRQVTLAIAHAHAQGVVHRDLKPHNVLIDGDGDAYVVDFGLARDAAAASAHTVAGQLLGTPQYMSPEQARGDLARIGETSDVWALGALLYECVTGRGPFAGLPLHATIAAILEQEPVWPRALDRRVPGALEAVVCKALHKRPEDRYTSALAFGEELERFAQGEPVLAKPPSRAAALARRAWRQRRTLGAVGLAVAAVVVWFTSWVLPAMRREGVLTAAAQACADGFPGAALAPLRAELARLSPADGDHQRCELALANALVDRAAELHVAGKVAEAEALAAEARLLTMRDRTSMDNAGTLSPEWPFADLRAWAVQATQQRFEPPVAELQRRQPLLAMWRSSSPTEQWIGEHILVYGDVPWLADEGDEVVVPIALQMHAAAARAAAAGREFEFPMPPLLQTTSSPRRAWFDRRAVVLALVASLARAADDVEYHRVVLQTLFQVFDLPVEHWAQPGPASRWPDRAVFLQAAQRVAQQLADAARADTGTAWRKVARLWLASLAQPSAANEPPLPLAAIGARRWLGLAPGFAGEDFAAWLARSLDDAPATWLRASLGREAAGAEAPRDLLARLATTPDEVQRFACWHLLQLQAPAGVDVPLGPPPQGDSLAAWRERWLRAFGEVDERRYSVQLALLHFADGASEPELLATAAVAATIGVPFECVVQGRVVHSWCRANRRQSTGLEGAAWSAVAALAAIPEAVGVRLQAELGEDARGVFLGLGQRNRARWVARYDLPGVVARLGTSDLDLRLRVGHAGGAHVVGLRWDDGRRRSDFVLLARLAPADERAPSALAPWRQAVVAQLAIPAGATNVAAGDVDWVTASLWSLPEACDALAARFDRLPSFRLWAAILAGDARRTPPWDYPDQDGATLARVLLTGAAKRHHERAGAELERLGDRIAPGVAAQLCRAMDRGELTLSPRLAARVRGLAVLRDAWPWCALGGLCLFGATVVAFAVRLLRRRGVWRAAAAVVALVGSWALLGLELHVFDVSLAPRLAVVLAIAAAAWLAPLPRTWLWWALWLVAVLRCGCAAAAAVGFAQPEVVGIALEWWLSILVWANLITLAHRLPKHRQVVATGSAPLTSRA